MPLNIGNGLVPYSDHIHVVLQKKMLSSGSRSAGPSKVTNYSIVIYQFGVVDQSIPSRYWYVRSTPIIMTFYLRLLGKISCHIYNFGGNIGGQQALKGFAKTLFYCLQKMWRNLPAHYDRWQACSLRGRYFSVITDWLEVAAHLRFLEQCGSPLV